MVRSTPERTCRSRWRSSISGVARPDWVSGGVGLPPPPPPGAQGVGISSRNFLGSISPAGPITSPASSFFVVVDAAQHKVVLAPEPRSLAPAGDGHDDDDDEDDDDEDGVAAFKPCRLRSPWQAGIRLRFPGAWSLDLLEDGSALAPPPPKKTNKGGKGRGEGGPQERGGIEQPQE